MFGRRACLVPALLAAGLVVPVAGAARALPNPCAFVTVAQVKELLGSAIVSTVPRGTKLYRSCTWTGRNMSASGFAPAQRTLMIELRQSSRSAFLADGKAQAGAVNVSGVGQLAWTIPRAGFLNVYADGYALELDAGLVPSALATEKSAAKLLLRHL